MKHLTKEQRYVIKALLSRGVTQQEIAKELGVNKSTISREIDRNKTKTGKYNPEKAHMFAQERKERFASNRKFTKTIEKRIRYYLENEQWSPEQIVGYCKNNGIEMVSVERIYQFIREDKQAGGELYKHLRHKLKHRKAVVGKNKTRIKNRVSIDERPDEVQTRETFGHFECDLVVGKDNKGAILTLIERKTRFFMCEYLPYGKNAEKVAETIIKLLLPYKYWVETITFDNGKEFAKHQLVADKLEAKTYFTHPYSSWEKGQIEYANKLLRQYVPKKIIINESNTQNLKEIQYKINRRPRKNLNYDNPKNLFFKFVNNKVAFAG
jgi:IS30 family transposase